MAMLLIRSFLILFAFTWLGNQLAAFIDVGIPGSIFGMLGLFVAMVTKAIPAHWVEAGSTQLLKYLPLLFIPICTGLMIEGDLIREYGVVLLVSNVFSTLLVLVMVGLICERGLK